VLQYKQANEVVATFTLCHLVFFCTAHGLGDGIEAVVLLSVLVAVVPVAPSSNVFLPLDEGDAIPRGMCISSLSLFPGSHEESRSGVLPLGFPLLIA
jgi:hypothetical protein